MAQPQSGRHGADGVVIRTELGEARQCEGEEGEVDQLVAAEAKALEIRAAVAELRW